jgi:sucrose-6-phosphate hydrolase SacC (GH32 family)
MKLIRVFTLMTGLVVSTGFQARQVHPEEFDLTPQEVAGEQHYRQPLRPQFHYTPIQGHIGDATGLIYYRGEYHLFNMYDEWSRRRLAHKRWGHAISTDLIHWRQMPPLLDTLLDNRPGSGSGVVDWNNSSGLRLRSEQTLLIFYTDYKAGYLYCHQSRSRRTWARYGKNPVIAGADDARDPTVFWYSPAAEWRMVRYEREDLPFTSRAIWWSGLGSAGWKASTSVPIWWNCRSAIVLMSAAGF